MIVLWSVVALFFVSGIYWLNHDKNATQYDNVVIGKQSFHLEIANTPSSWQKGLSGRAELGNNQGMLFVFNNVGNWRMWMINMRFDIDIAWLNQTGRILYIKSDATPASYPATFGTNLPSYYVIEVPANTFNKLNVHSGDIIKKL
jgi:uncharacterized membrane protein (UPF0127 family)